MDRGLLNLPVNELPFGYALHRMKLDGSGCDFEYIQVNHTFELLIGLKKEAVIGRTIKELFPNLLASGFDWTGLYRDIVEKGLHMEYEQYITDLDKYFKVEAYSNRHGYFVSFLIDISTEIKKRELYKSVLLAMDDGIISAGPDGSVTMMNMAAEKITGIAEKDATGKPLSDIFRVFTGAGQPVAVELKNPLTAPQRADEGMYLQTNKNEGVSVSYGVFPIIRKGEKLGTVITFKDISEKVREDKKISNITYHDTLTGLYNRTFFEEHVPDFDTAENLPLSIIMGDINGLKLTNDAFGHLNGDRLLEAAAAALKTSCRGGDLIVRWGGDEFIVILKNTDKAGAEDICSRIKLNAENEKVDFLNLSISLGYATKTGAAENFDDVLKAAEEMMYYVKLLESKSMKNKTLNIIMRTMYERSKTDSRHAENVSRLCGFIGGLLELNPVRISELELLGLVHDIGKVGINPGIALKPAQLNMAEWSEIKRHPEIGYHIISSSGEMAGIAAAVLTHHEKYDGSGYPEGLKGKDIPLMARILTVANAFDSMTTDRAYKKRMSRQEALRELAACSGKQFDPDIVAVFVKNADRLPSRKTGSATRETYI
jgi:diguanylate cyclase (GGDEF)-like protein/PAS domain S-box-containing protein